MSSKTPKIPDGYRQDAQGRLVPEATIKPIDLHRDALVLGVHTQALEVAGIIATFKQAVLGQVDAFVQESADRFGARMGGSKGNLTFTTFDGKLKLVVAVQETLVFDERLQVAKQLVDECIRGWSEGSRPEIITLVADAFRVDKAGNISAGRILGLRRLEIKDRKWEKAMKAISESVSVASSKRYVRIYERNDETGAYQPISLDVAAA